MSDFLLKVIQYYGAGAATLAALIISLHISVRWTGYAFVIFVTSSLALISWGFLSRDAEGIGVQNIVLLIINCLGVYRYLLSGKRERENE